MTVHDLVTRARRARRRDQLHVVVRNVLRADLFVLDEFLPLEAADATFLFEVVNKRSKPPIRLSSPATRASGSGGRSSYRLRHRRRGRTGRSVVTDHPQASEVSTFRRRFCPFSRFEPARLATPPSAFIATPGSASKTTPGRHSKRPPLPGTENDPPHDARFGWRNQRTT